MLQFLVQEVKFNHFATKFVQVKSPTVLLKILWDSLVAYSCVTNYSVRQFGGLQLCY